MPVHTIRYYKTNRLIKGKKDVAVMLNNNTWYAAEVPD